MKSTNPAATERPAPATGGRGSVPLTKDIEAEVEQMLGALGSSNVRLSLLSLKAPPIPSHTVAMLVESALATTMAVGLLPDGSVGILDVGPRANGGEGDRALEAFILEKVKIALADIARAYGVHALGVRTVHRWSNEMDDAEAVVQMLLHAVPREERLPQLVNKADRPPLSRPFPPLPPKPGRGSYLFGSGRRWIAVLPVLLVASLALMAPERALAATDDPSQQSVRAVVGQGGAGSQRSMPATTARPAGKIAAERRETSWAPPLALDTGLGAATLNDVARFLGSNLSSGMEPADQVYLAYALAFASDGTSIDWVSPATGTHFSIYIVKTDVMVDQHACRAFTLTSMDGTNARQIYRTFCRRTGAASVATSGAMAPPNQPHREGD